jgi:hypothetical protein
MILSPLVGRGQAREISVSHPVSPVRTPLAETTGQQGALEQHQAEVLMVTDSLIATDSLIGV